MKLCPKASWTDVTGEDMGPEYLPLWHYNLPAHSLWFQYLPHRIYIPIYGYGV